MADFTSFSFAAQGLALIPISYIVCLVAYRVFFHSLRKVPGPLIASITSLYQFRYNISQSGRPFYLVIEELHKEYGPIVRIGPNEVHLANPDHHHTIHKIGTKFYKDPEFYENSFGSPRSVFATASNELHRVRRAAVSPLFTRARVLEQQYLVQEKVAKFCKRLDEDLSASNPFHLGHATHSISVDVITDYGFDSCYNLLDSPDLGASYFAIRRKSQPRLWINQQFPIALRLMQLPMWVTASLVPPIHRFLVRKEAINKQVQAIERQMQEGKKPPENKRTIFHQLLDPNAAEGYVVPPISAISDDAFIFVAAASETVGNTLTQVFWRCLADDAIRQRLIAELKSHFPDGDSPLSFPDLEKLPYLTACLKEALRLTFALPGRLPRTVGPGGATFEGQFLPAGTSVSMSQWMMHRDPTIFPEPMRFSPDRWLDEKGQIAHIGADKYLVAFGRGSRVCLGMTLAWSELYVIFGTVVRRYGEKMQLQPIGEEDFYPIADYVSGWQREDARKLVVVGRNT